MKELIVKRAFALGFDDCRVAAATPPASGQHFREWLAARRHGEMGYLERNADKRLDPSLVLQQVRSIITVAASYASDAETADHLSPHGVVARYARYRDYHQVLGQRLTELSTFIRELHADARALWYVDTGPILERDAAQRSGIGFIGKHTNLISRKLGNWILLGEILSTVELEPDPPERNLCGSCTRCLDACPTQAISAPFQLDARRCISYLTIELKGSIPPEFRRAIGNRIFGCDDCLAVCPWNRFARVGQLMKPFARGDMQSPDLLCLLSLDEAGFKTRFAGTPIVRAKRRGFLRNVCVALGNVGDSNALPALERAASDPEPLIAEHATWAVEQIQQRFSVPKELAAREVGAVR